jgi:fructoselysine-6-P-deglycase FrlB-like protein
MNSIEAMESEISFQLDLPRLELQKQDKKCLFVGSGDSFAASLAAVRACRSEASCCYPEELVENPKIADGKTVYVVSVSGRTKHNILAAKVARRRGSKTVAITSNPHSLLASSCDRTIHLKYESAQATTAGTVSFTSSLITCISLVTEVTFPKKMEDLLELAKKQADRSARQMRSAESFFLLGDGLLFPIALYGALKLNEVLGAKALPYPVGEFCHSPLFSLQNTDALLALVNHDDDGGSKLTAQLASEGFNSESVFVSGAGVLQALLHSTFFMQFLVLALAKHAKLKECHFVRDRTLLGISSSFIYD